MINTNKLLKEVAMAITITGKITQTGKSIALPTPTPSNGSAGVFFGGQQAGDVPSAMIEWITIDTTANATDFGDLTILKWESLATSNSSNDRGVSAGGHTWSNVAFSDIDWITISSPSNGTDYGDLSVARGYGGAVSNGTTDKGVFFLGGTAPGVYSSTIDYITISSGGTASLFGDFGERGSHCGGASNGTNDRGVFPVGRTTESGWMKNIYYITISSGNTASLFGVLTGAIRAVVGGVTSNLTNERAVFGGGYNGYVDIIDYVTISSANNAIDFGDLINGDRGFLGACSSGTDERGVFAGGLNSGGEKNIIDFITISSAGNSTDFGELAELKRNATGTSNA